jgi:DNA-binding GntR family transcriptional regulator
MAVMRIATDPGRSLARVKPPAYATKPAGSYIIGQARSGRLPGPRGPWHHCAMRTNASGAAARGASPALIHETLRRAIIDGSLRPGERLKVLDLAARFGSSTNPVREALRQLQGEGFVVIAPNRGARVRPFDAAFLGNIYDIMILLEPYLVRGFVAHASAADIAALAALQREIEAVGFSDAAAFSRLDERFHGVTYLGHHNGPAVALWRTNRSVLHAVSRGLPISAARGRAITRQHRALLAAIRRHDADRAAAVIERHVRESGAHLLEQLRARAPRDSG